MDKKATYSAIKSFVLSIILVFSFLSVSQVTAACPTGMISYWKGEGNGNDVVGSNSMSLYNGNTYATYNPNGKVGQAFSFGGVSADGGYALSANAMSFSPNNDFTLETWFRLDPNAQPGEQSLMVNYIGGGFGPWMPTTRSRWS